MIGRRKQRHVILLIVSVLLGSGLGTIGDFSSEQPLPDPLHLFRVPSG